MKRERSCFQNSWCLPSLARPGDDWIIRPVRTKDVAGGTGFSGKIRSRSPGQDRYH